MANRRRSLKLLAHERELLVRLYMQWRIPIDQFEKRPADWESFVCEWRDLSKRNDAPGDLLHYMRSQRKMGRWVTLGAKSLEAPAPEPLAAEEVEALVEIFDERFTNIESCTDVLGYDPELAQEIANAFSQAVGRVVPAHELVAKLTALRKRGLLSTSEERVVSREEVGFHDIDEASGR